jgi:hypothetical protein
MVAIGPIPNGIPPNEITNGADGPAMGNKNGRYTV